MLSVETILAAVCEEFCVPCEALWGASRARHIALARQIACALLHELRPDLSLEAIGIEVNRDHTTVIYALRRIADLAATSPYVAARLADIRTRLRPPPPPAPVVVPQATWAAWWGIQSLNYEAVSA